MEDKEEVVTEESGSSTSEAGEAAEKKVTDDDVIEALKTVEDPELFLDIWFLGLVYMIDVDEDVVKIQMTFTSPMCPAGPSLIADVKQKVDDSEGVSNVEVEVVFEPKWEPSDEVKAMLGMM